MPEYDVRQMYQKQYALKLHRIYNPFRVVIGRAYRGLTGGFLLLRNFSIAISVSPHVLFYLGFNSDFYVSKIVHL